MPTPKRWFPKDRDFNHDPEGWELTKKFGERAVRLWDEILAIVDKNENHWRMDGEALLSVARLVRMSPGSCFLAMDWMVQKRWITLAAEGGESFVRAWSATRERLVSSPSATREGPLKGSSAIRELFVSGSSVVVSTVNYWKYHRSAEPKSPGQRSVSGTKKSRTSILPNITFPNRLKKDPASEQPGLWITPENRVAAEAELLALAEQVAGSDSDTRVKTSAWVRATWEVQSREPAERVFTVIAASLAALRRKLDSGAKVDTVWGYLSGCYDAIRAKQIQGEEQRDYKSAVAEPSVSALFELEKIGKP